MGFGGMKDWVEKGGIKRSLEEKEEGSDERMKEVSWSGGGRILRRVEGVEGSLLVVV